MKRFAYYIACCTLVALCACTHDDTNDVIPAGNGKIMIQASLDDMAITRAFDGETAKERTVTHIDVFAVDPEGNIDYYERNTAGNNNGTNEDGSGVLTLNVARRAKIGNAPVFEEGVAYKFYLVANSRTPVEDIKDSNGLKDGFKTEEGLKKWIFDDIIEIEENVIQTNLHLTGTTLGETNDTDVDNTNRQPQTFLMDAVAKFGSDESVVVNPTTGGESSLKLSAEFKRAAAKILVNIKQGPDVVFHKNLSVVLKEKDSETTKKVDQTAKYYFYKLPASTFVLPNDQQLVNPFLITTASMDAPQAVNPNEPGNEQVFKWSENISDNGDAVDVQVLGYAYAHEWSDVDLTNETSLILNIPMYYKENDTTNPNRDKDGMAPAPNSWYKVPLSKDKIFKRNTCYVVNITINAVGATNKSDAIQLRNIEYETLPWQAVGIEVGNDENRPAYLELNTDLVEIYNANFDNTSLSFSSSSAITSVTLKDVYKQNADGTFTSDTDNHDAYYINKFGVKTSLSETIRNTISATAEENVLNGAISILSPIVPATQAEINKQILEQLGPAPTAPTLTEPTYDGTIVPEPSFVAEPDPDDYIQTTITNSNWVESGGIGTTKRTRTNTETQRKYKYEDGKYTFQLSTRTRTETQNRFIEWQESTYTDWSDWSDWSADTTTQNAWDTAWGNYHTYLTNKAAYDAQQKEPDFQAYLAEKQAYDNAWAEYNDELADYNEQADAIREAAGGEETHYNTIRYLEFEVTNEQGLTATFRVMQYPVIYVVNIEGFFSYRSDFYHSSGTEAPHWQNRVAPYCYRAYWASYTIQRRSGSSDSWTNVETGYGPIYYNGSNYYCSRGQLDNNRITYTGSDGYSYRITYNSVGQVFQSRVTYSVYETGNNVGKSNIDGYYNNGSSWGRSDDSGRDPGNHRMYHVRVTATSDDYTAGRPRILNDNGEATDDVENGYTDNSLDNSKIVSPSFMTASQLGMTTSESDLTIDQLYERAKDQCKNYVETYKDSSGTVIHLKDWRLPTKAEIDIIVQLQAKTEGAVDLVLAGQYYMCASPTKYTNGAANPSSNGYFIRCVRDAYDK